MLLQLVEISQPSSKESRQVGDSYGGRDGRYPVATAHNEGLWVWVSWNFFQLFWLFNIVVFLSSCHDKKLKLCSIHWCENETLLHACIIFTFTGLIDIAVGGSSSSPYVIAVTADGTMFGWGSNVHGEVGHTNSPVLAPTPIQLSGMAGIRITKVSCGWLHNLALSEAGQVMNNPHDCGWLSGNESEV